MWYFFFHFNTFLLSSPLLSFPLLLIVLIIIIIFIIPSYRGLEALRFLVSNVPISS